MPSGGPLLIAEVGFSVAIQHMLSMRVAALCVYEGRMAGEKQTWESVGRALCHRSVRLIAGELSDMIFTALRSWRMRGAVKACAVEPTTQKNSGSHWLASSSMLVMGPVGHITMSDTGGSSKWPSTLETRGSGVRIKDPADERWAGMLSTLTHEAFTGKAGEDETRGWPFIECVKQKKVITVLPHTKNMMIFMGSSKARRQPGALAYRADRRNQRASAHNTKPWSQPFRMDAKSYADNRGNRYCENRWAWGRGD